MENNNIKDILELINTLQRNNCNDNPCSGCTKPFLGTNTCPNFNTRPITIQSCQGTGLWTMPYTLNNVAGTSSIFRVENVDGCCATFRILAENPEGTCPYSLTNSYFTMDINCILSLQCLPDTCAS